MIFGGNRGVPRQYAGLTAWWDGKDILGNGSQPSIGSAVSSWVDKSGNGLNMNQATGTAQPTLQSDGVLFDGTSDFLTSTTFTLASTFTIIIAVNNIVGASGIIGQGTDNSKITRSNSTGMLFIRVLNGSMADQPIMFPSGKSIFIFTRNSANKVDFSLNGAPYSRLYADVAQVGNMRISRLGRDDASNFCNGTISEVCIYNTDLSTNAFNVARYMGNRWGIATS